MREEVKRWWGKAKRDFSTSNFLFKGRKYEESIFFSQQAAEKALKALSLKKFNRIRKIHDLVELGKDVKLPNNILENLRELTLAYVYSRYPDVQEPEDLKGIAISFLKYAEEVLKWTEKNL